MVVACRFLQNEETGALRIHPSAERIEDDRVGWMTRLTSKRRSTFEQVSQNPTKGSPQQGVYIDYVAMAHRVDVV